MPSLRDMLTGEFENYVLYSTPVWFSGSTKYYQFYFDSGVNIGFGYNVSGNLSVARQNLENTGLVISNQTWLYIKEFTHKTVDPILKRLVTIDDINNSFNQTITATQAYGLMDDFYSAHASAFISILQDAGVVNPPPSFINSATGLALQDLFYNTYRGGDTDSAIPVGGYLANALDNTIYDNSDLGGANYADAAYEVAFATNPPNSKTIRLALSLRRLAEAFGVIGGVVTTNGNHIITSVDFSNTPTTDIINFFYVLDDHSQDILKYFMGLPGKATQKSFSVALSALEAEAITRGFYVTETGTTYAKIANFIKVSDDRAGLIANINGAPNGSTAISVGQFVYIPTAISYNGPAIKNLSGAGVTYFYDTYTHEFVTTAANPDGSNIDAITVVDGSGNVIEQLPAGSVSQIKLGGGEALITLAKGLKLTDSAMGSSFSFGGKPIQIASGDTVQVVEAGSSNNEKVQVSSGNKLQAAGAEQPTYIVNITNSDGDPDYVVSYFGNGIETLAAYDSHELISQDTEFPDGISAITTTATLPDGFQDYVVTEYTGPGGTGQIIDPGSISNYTLYVWVGGNGDFGNVNNWDAPDYDPNANPPDPVPTEPGETATVTFTTGGTITGGGNVCGIVIDSAVTVIFDGNVVVGDANLVIDGSYLAGISNNGSLDIQGLIVGNGIGNSGILSIEGTVESPAGGISNSGSFTLNAGGTVDLGEYVEEGTGQILSEGTLDADTVFINTGSLTVTGADAICTSSFVEAQYLDPYEAPPELAVSDDGEIATGSLQMYLGVLNVSGGGLVAYGTELSIGGAAVVVDGAGSKMTTSGGFIFIEGPDNSSNTNASSLSVQNGGFVNGQLIVGEQTEGSVAPESITVDGPGSELDANGFLQLASGTMTVSNGGLVELGTQTSSDDYEVGGDGSAFEVIGGVGTGGTLLIESGGTMTADDGQSAQSYADLGGETGDQSSIVVTGENSLLDLGAQTLNVESVLTVADGGVASAGQIYIADGGVGSVMLSNGTLDGDNISNYGTVSGYGTIAGDLFNAGTVTVSGGTLELAGDLSGTGSIAVSGEAILQLGGAIDAGVTIQLAGTGAALSLGDLADALGTISGFTSGNTIDLSSLPLTTLSFSGGVLTLEDGTKVEGTLNLVGSYSTANFVLSSDGNGGTDITFAESATDFSPNAAPLFKSVGLDDTPIAHSAMVFHWGNSLVADPAFWHH